MAPYGKKQRLAALSSPAVISRPFGKRDSSRVHTPNFLEGPRLTFHLGLSPAFEHLCAPGSMQTVLCPQYCLILVTTPAKYWGGWPLIASPLSIPSLLSSWRPDFSGKISAPDSQQKCKKWHGPLSDTGIAPNWFKLVRVTHLSGLSCDLLMCCSFFHSCTYTLECFINKNK